MKNKMRVLSIILLIFVGLNAAFGGFMLMTDPTGASLKLPFELLDKTPFNSFMIPGIILFTVIGLMSLIIAYITIRKGTLYPLLILIQGIVLGIWLTAELTFDQAFYAPQYHIPLYLIAGLLILLGFKLGKSKSKSSEPESLVTD